MHLLTLLITSAETRRGEAGQEEALRVEVLLVGDVCEEAVRVEVLLVGAVCEEAVRGKTGPTIN